MIRNFDEASWIATIEKGYERLKLRPSADEWCDLRLGIASPLAVFLLEAGLLIYRFPNGLAPYYNRAVGYTNSTAFVDGYCDGIQPPTQWSESSGYREHPEFQAGFNFGQKCRSRFILGTSQS